MGIKGNLRVARARSWPCVLLVVCLGQSLPAAADPESDQIAELRKELEQSMQMIRELSQKVHDLEVRAAQQSATPTAPGTAPATSATARAPTPPGPAAPTPAAAAPAVAAAAPAPPAAAATSEASRLTQLEQTVAQMATNAWQRAEDIGMPMHGFADVGVGTHNPEFPDYRGVDVGELDFFLTPRLGARTRALFELNFEVGSDGTVGVDLERAQIGYQFSDSATIWLGRFHTPYGFYNTAFHHGQWIAISLRRPRFIEFEDHGGIMPAHTTGLWLTGSERLGGDMKVTYDAYVGNSQRIVNGILDMNNAGVPRGSTIVGGNVGLLPGGALDGLKVGVDAFQTRIEDEDPTPAAFPQVSPYFTRVRSYGAYAVYDTDRWEDIAELHFFDNTDLTGHTGSHHSDAGFIQMGYRGGRYTPYARYERGSFQQSDPYFAAQINGNSYDREALGVRFDIDLSSALKMEFAKTTFADRIIRTYGEALVQYAIRF
ncbi:MAG TPA: hypothetical protein VNV40_09865 [Steroidobacteraceae bacterium]|nr:hypothetical protein [Steroidobacteraceae bacterium]